MLWSVELVCRHELAPYFFLQAAGQADDVREQLEKSVHGAAAVRMVADAAVQAEAPLEVAPSPAHSATGSGGGAGRAAGSSSSNDIRTAPLAAHVAQQPDLSLAAAAMQQRLERLRASLSSPVGGIALSGAVAGGQLCRGGGLAACPSSARPYTAAPVAGAAAGSERIDQLRGIGSTMGRPVTGRTAAAVVLTQAPRRPPSPLVQQSTHLDLDPLPQHSVGYSAALRLEHLQTGAAARGSAAAAVQLRAGPLPPSPPKTLGSSAVSLQGARSAALAVSQPAAGATDILEAWRQRRRAEQQVRVS